MNRRLTFYFILAFLALTHVYSMGMVTVEIEGFAFTPQDVTIPVGETVQWINLDTVRHTSTSDTLVWDSGLLAEGDTFEFTFDDVGVYPYHCTVHPTMTGTVTVSEDAAVESTSFGEIKAVFK
jgi:plastocyanin